MATLDPKRTKRHLDIFDWETLFIEELGWLSADGLAAMTLDVGGETFAFEPVAHLGGVAAFEVASPEGRIPSKAIRRAVHKAVESRAREHVLLFTDGRRTQTVWSYPVYDGKTLKTARSHHFVKGQPPDLFISKLAALFFDMEELSEDGDASLVEVTRRVRAALDVEQVTKKFYAAFKGEQEALAERHITGIEAERTRRHYASVLLTRLMFVYFLQKKGFLDRGDRNYLGTKLAAHKAHIRGILDPPSFYRRVLRPLFFEGFALRPAERSPETNALLGEVRYLNGGLFLEHPIEEEHPDLDVADAAVEGILGVFDQFTWHLDDTPGGRADEINPDVLGYILEKYVNQKAFGAYYTPPELTGYLCDATLDRLLTERLSDDAETSAALGLPARRFDALADLLTSLDDDLAWELLGVLKELTVLDPACGSGAFLVAALKKLLTIYKAVLGHAELSKDANLKKWLAEAQAHPSTGYFIKKEIITRNLYGVDLMPEATEIAKLRLFLALVASAERPEDLEPLPNIDFNLLDGNSLVGLLDVSDEALVGAGDAKVGAMFAAQEFRDSLREKDRLVDLYRGTAETVDRDDDSGTLLQIRDRINTVRADGQRTLDQVAAEQMHNLGVKVQKATWDGKKVAYAKRAVATSDVSALHPFHWAYEFSRIIERGGFDVIITNPPWDVLKPQGKEFFQQYADLQVNNTPLVQYEEMTDELLEEPEVRAAWLDYLSTFKHQSQYFRSAPDYQRQTGEIDLYKLFVERSFRLLREEGHCGIILSSGIYNNKSSMPLRKLLFEECELDSLFGISNERLIFQDVHHSFTVAILAYRKGGKTSSFDSAFRLDPREAVSASEIAGFLRNEENHIRLPVTMVEKLSPDTLSIPQFKVALDRDVALKMSRFPLLKSSDGGWGISLTNGFHSSKKHLLSTSPASGRLPLIRGTTITHFDYLDKDVTEWVEEATGRAELIGSRGQDAGQQLYYERYTLAYRRIGRSTDSRTLYAAIIPPKHFAHESLTVVTDELSGGDLLVLLAMLNSLVVDFLIGQRVSANISAYYVYQLPVPRLDSAHPHYQFLVERSGRLVCTSHEFDALAREVGLQGNSTSLTTKNERAEARLGIDALVAHVYRLTEQEFEHVLANFPQVEEAYKVAVLAAYRALAPHPDSALVERQIADGESALVEFKETFAVDAATGDKHKGVLHSALKTVCGFLNASGGTLLLGVDDDGTVQGLAKDYATCQATNQNADGLENKLLTTLRDRLVPPPSFGHVRVTFHEIGGAEVCRVLVAPSDQPTRLDGDFFVRYGNTTRALSDAEAERWLQNRARRA